MSSVVHLHAPSRLDALWEQYQTLARAQLDNPALALDRDHVERTLRAFSLFQNAFAATEARR